MSENLDEVGQFLENLNHQNQEEVETCMKTNPLGKKKKLKSYKVQPPKYDTRFRWILKSLVKKDINNPYVSKLFQDIPDYKDAFLIHLT